jgi:hypothetical protein
MPRAMKLYCEPIDGDSADISHRFVYKHAGKVEASLQVLPSSYNSRQHSTSRSAHADMDGRAVSIHLKEVMGTTGPPVDGVQMSASARTQAYDEYVHLT